jgi:Protein of unknown function (DUF2877)
VAFAVASTVLHDLLRSPARAARVIAVLPSAVYLEIPDAPIGTRLIALLARDAIRVPIGMVVALPRHATPFAGCLPGAGAVIGDGVLGLDGGDGYRPLRYWDPRVPHLRAGLGAPAALHRAEALIGLGGGLPPELGLQDGAAALAGALAEPSPRSPALTRAVRCLVGLGPGLTPAGDDVLAGALVTLAAAGDDVRRRALAAAVRRRPATTPVSVALLEQACHGRAVPELSALLRALAGVGDLDAALVGLALVGHTSGPALGLGVRSALRARAGLILGRAA